MYAAINAWTLTGCPTPADQIHAAADAGFTGIELTLALDGSLTPDTPETECQAWAAMAADRGLDIAGLASAVFWQTNFAAPDPATRQAAFDLTRRMLELAAALGSESILVVPAVVGEHLEPRPRVTYADALRYTLDALNDLRYEAESHDVTIGVENVWNRFLLSPIEFADLLDAVNSPHVAAYFDTANVLPFGYPQDWIATLGHRVHRVHAKDFKLGSPDDRGFCPLGEGDVDWPAVLAALRQVGYAGPLTYEGPGDPAQLARRLTEMIATPPPTQE